MNPEPPGGRPGVSGSGDPGGVQPAPEQPLAPAARRSRRGRPGGLASVIAEVGSLAAAGGLSDAEADPEPPDEVIVPRGRVRRMRRRRSASAVPPVPRPADVPEDAGGRVEFVTVEPVVIAPPAVGGPAGEPAALAGRTGWLPLLLLGVAILAVFVLGMLATR